jgi:hypothetical protein
LCGLRTRELDRVADSASTFPMDLVREASRISLRTLKMPKEYGGTGHFGRAIM